MIPDILSPDRVELVLVFIVPGFVSLKTWRLINPSQPTKTGDQILDLVVFSLLNYLLLYWLLSLSVALESVTARIAIQFTVLAVFPILWPVAIRAIITSKLLRGRVVHPTPTSWDHFFGLGRSCFILIHLNSGKLIGGLYTGESFASSYPEERDLYISQVWHVNPDGQFLKPVDQTAGMLITYDQIAYLELFRTAPQGAADVIESKSVEIGEPE